MPEVSVTYQPLEALEPAEVNPKDHDIPAIKASIRRFGFTLPIMVDERTGRLTAGHGRLRALAEMHAAGEPCPDRVKDGNGSGWLVPVLRGVAFADDDAAAAYLLADNRLTERGGWHDADLAVMLQDLAERDALEGSGFDNDDLRALLSRLEPKGGKVDPDHVPEAVPTRATAGDVWVCGDHRIICGDSADAATVERLLAGRRADLVYTDPPWNVAYEGGTKKQEALVNDDLDSEAWAAWLQASLEVIPTATNAPAYVFFGAKRTVETELAVSDAGWRIVQHLVWVKNHAQYGNFRAHYKYRHEDICYCSTGAKVPEWYGPNNEESVWEADRSARNDLHPTQKPVEIAERAIRNSTQHGAVVFDGFLGSGSTLIAAERLGRACYGVEIEPKYVDVAVKRWEEYTGQTAYKEGSDGR